MIDRELPKYQSHKKVWALKIKSISHDGEGENRETDGSAMITPEESYAPFKVDSEYMHKHKPQVGGYYVVYDDGYKSWSPSEAFENGYTKIDSDTKRHVFSLSHNSVKKIEHGFQHQIKETRDAYLSKELEKYKNIEVIIDGGCFNNMNKDYEKAKELGLTKLNRWEDGIDHHPMSEKLVRFMADHDFNDYNDNMCIKIGGDGDNGEQMMYLMDAFFEMMDVNST